MDFKEIKEKLSFFKYIDPFYYVDRYLMPKVNPSGNELVSWVVYIVSAFVFAVTIYIAMGLILATPSPMVIVVSGSMEPTYYRGDVIVLQGVAPGSLLAHEVNLQRPTLKNVPLVDFARTDYVNDKIIFENEQEVPFNRSSDIVVYFSELKQQPIIHRAVAKIRTQDGWYVITKGDNNKIVDQECGIIAPGYSIKNCISLYAIPVEKIEGKAILRIPMIGCAKLWIFDNISSLITTGSLPADFRGIC